MVICYGISMYSYVSLDLFNLFSCSKKLHTFWPYLEWGIGPETHYPCWYARAGRVRTLFLLIIISNISLDLTPTPPPQVWRHWAAWVAAWRVMLRTLSASRTVSRLLLVSLWVVGPAWLVFLFCFVVFFLVCGDCRWEDWLFVVFSQAFVWTTCILYVFFAPSPPPPTANECGASDQDFTSGSVSLRVGSHHVSDLQGMVIKVRPYVAPLAISYKRDGIGDFGQIQPYFSFLIAIYHISFNIWQVSPLSNLPY